MLRPPTHIDFEHGQLFFSSETHFDLLRLLVQSDIRVQKERPLQPTTVDVDQHFMKFPTCKL
jgi:hypothetical protein